MNRTDILKVLSCTAVAQSTRSAVFLQPVEGSQHSASLSKPRKRTGRVRLLLLVWSHNAADCVSQAEDQIARESKSHIKTSSTLPQPQGKTAFQARHLVQPDTAAYAAHTDADSLVVTRIEAAM